MTFDDVRRDISTLLGIRIPPKSFEAIVHEADQNGRVGNRQIIGILIALYNYLESNVKKEEDVRGK